MKNDYKLIELAIKKLLKFMQLEAEKYGRNVKGVTFNFTPKFKQYFLTDHEPEEVPEGEDLTVLKELTGLEEKILIQAIKIALSRRYLSNIGYYPTVKKEHRNAEYDLFVSLSDDGHYEAMCIDYDIFEERIGQKAKESDSYYQEKRKGGLNSYQKYKPLRDKVFDLCALELKNKKYSSAEQLCKKVAKVIEEQHLSLLDNFEPYQLVLKDGGDWLKPTFYGWCNKVYKRSA